MFHGALLAWLAIVVVATAVTYGDFNEKTNGQPEFKTVAFDHLVAFKFLGADTGKYGSNLLLNESEMKSDGWYGEIVIRQNEPNAIIWKYLYVINGRIIDSLERKYDPPAYYQLVNYDTATARYQRADDFTKTFTFAGLGVFIGLLTLVFGVYRNSFV